jgi:hypothetical protein
MTTSANATLTPPIQKAVIAESDLEALLSRADDGRSLLSPLAQMLIEIHTPTGLAISTMAIGLHRSVLVQNAVTEEGEHVVGVALHGTEHSPMVLARFLGIIGHRADTVRAQIVIQTNALVETPERGSAVDLLSALMTSQVDTDTAYAIGLLMASRRASWQVTSLKSGVAEDFDGATPSDALPSQRYRVTGFDAGPGGLWTITNDGVTVTINPVSASEMLRALVALFPRDRP